jgi:hypothetical protein
MSNKNLEIFQLKKGKQVNQPIDHSTWSSDKKGYLYKSYNGKGERKNSIMNLPLLTDDELTLKQSKRQTR